MEGFYEFAFKWPDAVKDNYGGLSAYFIPSKKGNKCKDAAMEAYVSSNDFRESPMRLEFANFVLKEIAREEKKKSLPISFDKSAKL